MEAQECGMPSRVDNVCYPVRLDVEIRFGRNHASLLFVPAFLRSDTVFHNVLSPKRRGGYAENAEGEKDSAGKQPWQRLVRFCSQVLDYEPDFCLVFSSGSLGRAKNASSSHSPFILRQTLR
jgi:hypothetical protein